MSSISATGGRMPTQPRVRSAPRVDRSSVVRVSLAAVLLYLLLIPEQFNITIGGVYLSPYRIFLLAAPIYLLTSALSKNLRFAWPDLFLVLGLIWITIASYATSNSLNTAMVQGGSHLVDIGLAYFVARATIQSPNDMRRFLILIAPGVIFTGLVIGAEAVSHRLIVQELASLITGNPAPARLDVRLGFMRGFASFPHPILAGIFLASMLPLYLLSNLRGWPKSLSIIGSVLGAFSMSSAALLGLVVGFVLFLYDRLTTRVANATWYLFMGASTIFYIVIETASNRGFYGLLVAYASLNTASASNRLLIWQFGTENIARNPWFGIGYADWDRPEWMHSDSFDWFWLILALRFGIPAAIFVLGATLMAIVFVAMKSRHYPSGDAALLRGVAISLGVFALGLNSVSLWMATLAWLFMLVGITVSLGTMPVNPKAYGNRTVQVRVRHGPKPQTRPL